MDAPHRTFAQLGPLARRYTRRMVGRVEYEVEPPLTEVFRAHPRLVHVLNHAHAFAFVPLFRLVELFVDNGGGDRVFFGAAHRLFYLPGIRRLGRNLTQADHALDVDELVACLREGPYTDFLVMPEGDHTLFGNGADVVPFTSPRFVEVALRAGAPMLLLVHSGTEPWARTWRFGERLPALSRALPERMRNVLAETRTLSFTVRPRRIPVLRLRGALYHPVLRLEELDPDPARRRAQLWVEADRVRARMQELLDALRAEQALAPD